MKIFYSLQRIILCIAFVFLFNACSATTTSSRYNQSKDKKENGNIAQTNNDNSSQSDKGTNDLVANSKSDLLEEEFDDLPVEENPIDKSKFVANYDKLKNFNVALTPRERILFEVIKFLDTPYKYGGNTDNGIDCSAFTKQVLESSVSVDLPRSAREQYSVGDKISKEDLKFGDLVFFNTRRRNNPGHVGIYLGDNQFVHASRTLGVTISSIEEKYYKTRYAGARRMMENNSQ